MLALFNVAIVLVPGVSGLGAKVTVVPGGIPAVAVSIIGVVKIPDTVVGIVTVGFVGAGQALVEAVVPPKLKSFTGAVTLKFVFEISKKILLIASTFTLAVVVEPVGITKASVPSFAVLKAKTFGKVNPPSVE